MIEKVLNLGVSIEARVWWCLLHFWCKYDQKLKTNTGFFNLFVIILVYSLLNFCLIWILMALCMVYIYVSRAFTLAVFMKYFLLVLILQIGEVWITSVSFWLVLTINHRWIAWYIFMSFQCTLHFFCIWWELRECVNCQWSDYLVTWSGAWRMHFQLFIVKILFLAWSILLQY